MLTLPISTSRYAYDTMVEEMMNQPKTKQLNKRIRVLLLSLAALLAAALIWALAVEPALLTVRQIEYADARLPEALDGMRIVYFADLHAGPYYKPAAVERLAAKISELKPDMLIFGGDMVQHEASALLLDYNRVGAALASVDAPLGKYAVYGNHDIISSVTKAVAAAILSEGGFTVLDNEAVEALPGFYIAGTAPWPTEGENSPRNLSDVSRVAWAAETGKFALLLSHEPAQLRKNAEYPFALQLSGHTHGGQIALPFVDTLRIADMDIYRAGFYREKNTEMYVSVGIGTSIVRIRMFVPPEIVVLTLRRETQ